MDDWPIVLGHPVPAKNNGGSKSGPFPVKVENQREKLLPQV